MHYHTKVVYEDSPTYYHHLIKLAPAPPFEVLEVIRQAWSTTDGCVLKSLHNCIHEQVDSVTAVKHASLDKLCQ
jgi:hypothetical protein